MKKKSLNKKYAWASFILLLFFWIPFFNIWIILPLSFYFGIKAILYSTREPKKYGGFYLSLFSIILCFLVFVYGVIIQYLIAKGVTL